jgi:hypothetical protein
MDREGVLRALAAALAVLAALLTPAVVARAGAEPAPSVSRLADAAVLPAEGPGARDWTPAVCRDDVCGVPLVLRLHGRSYERGVGTAQVVERGEVRTRTLHWALRQSGDPRHSVLVGALRSSSASDLVVEFGPGLTIPVPHGRLTLLVVPDTATTVTLVERGRPSAWEELRIQEYAER